MTDRSVRVVLSSSASQFIQELSKAEKSVKSLATAAIGVRGEFTHVTTEVGKLSAKLNGLGSNPGITGLVRDIDRVKAALSGLSGSHELTAIGSALTHLGAAGPGLHASVDDIRKLALALRNINAGSSSDLRDMSQALHAIGTLNLTGSAEAVTRLSAGIRRLIRDANSIPALRALAQALRDLGAAGAGLGNLGGSAQLGALQRQIDQLRHSVGTLRGAAGGGSSGGSSGGILGGLLGGGGVGRLAGYAAGYLALGTAIKSTYTQTATFETNVASFGAVTKTSGTQLKAVGDLAIKLGGDVSIAGANASDAAETMTELAKGGLSVADSMTAAKGTLQLASAAGVDFATAAGIQTAALNEFQLGADQAGKVADILSNSAAAASGEITDFAEGLKQSGAVAHGFGMSLLDNQTILAQFANAGIKGSMGGNILKSALLSVEKASGPSGAALKKLGVEVKNSNGTYITAAQLEEQLSAAKKRMGTTAYNTAAAVAFGSRGVIFANVAANAGAKGFDKMSTAISSGAGAAAFSQAKMSGLGGAFKNLQNQVETAQVTLGEKFSPALQGVVRSVSSAIPIITGFLTGSSLSGGLSSIGTWFKPLVDGSKALISTALPYVSSFVGSLGRGFGSVVTFVKPVADAIGNFLTSLASNGTVGAFGSVLKGVGTAFEGVLKFIEPVGTAIGHVIGFIGGLGPVATTAIVALGAMALLKGPLFGMFTAVGAGALRAANQVRIFTTTGLLSNLGNAARNAGRSLLGMFGGPWGLAITAATVGLSLFMGRTKDAGIATHDFTGLIDENTGALSTNAQATAADTLKDTLVVYKDAGGNVEDYTQAVLGNVAAQKRVADQFQLIGAKAIEGSSTWQKYNAQFAKAGITSDMVATAVGNGGDALLKLKQQYVAAGLQTTIGDVSTTLGSFGGALTSVSGIQKQYGADVTKFASDAKAGKTAYEASGAAASAAAAAWAKLPDFLQNGQDFDKANRLVAGSFAPVKAAAADAAASVVDSMLHAQQVYNNWVGHIPGIHIDTNDAKTGLATFSTAASRAFDRFKTDAQSASDQADLFFFHAAGSKVSSQQAIYATAAAMRAVGAAAQDMSANTDAVTSAQASLVAAQGKAIDKDYSQAQKILDVAAARRALKSAQDTQAGGEAALYNAGVDAAKLADQDVVTTYKQVAAKKGYKAGVAAATESMKQHRAAYIADYIAGKQSSMSDSEKVTSLTQITKEANNSADAIKLIPKKTEAYLGADNSVLIDKAIEAKKDADAFAKAQYKAVLTADSRDATDKANALKLRADAATALRTLKMNAEDDASAKVSALDQLLQGIQDKTVKLTVMQEIANSDIGSNNAAKQSASAAHPANVGGNATGGMVYGPGSGTSDSVLRWLSNGEGVNTAAAMDKEPNRRAMHFMNAGGVIPGFATGGLVGGLDIGMGGSGDAGGPSLSAVNAFMARASASAASLSAVNQAKATAAAAAAAAAAAIPKANAGGTEQWRALATRVAFAHNENIASVQVMLNQMARESGGNPAAINLTDSNAQAGHPSKGLLQFIDATFRAYADPGYNSNIYDPESQMRAWYNYINARYGGYASFAGRGYGAYANGGLISGAGSGRSDSNLVRVSNGEGINTAAAMSNPSNVGAMHYMNAGGIVPGFAGGGLTGTTGLNLSGRAPAQLGDAAGNVAQALADIAQAVADRRQQAVDSRAAATSAKQGVVDARATYGSARTDQNVNVRAAQATRRDVAKQAEIADVAAQKRVDAAKTSAAKAAAVAAQQRLNASQAIQSAAADRALAKVKSQEASKVEMARRGVVAALALEASTGKVADSFAAAAKAAAATQKGLQTTYRLEQARAALIDSTRAKLTAAQDRLSAAKDTLSSARSDKASAASQLASTAGGFDGGLTGHSDTRKTFATFLAGQRYDVAQIAGIRAQADALKAKGLNTKDISDAVNAALGGDGTTLKVLAGASKAQIGQANKTASALDFQSGTLGGLVAGLQFDPSIKAAQAGVNTAQGFVNGFRSQLDAIQRAMNAAAAVATAALTKALKIHSPSQVMHDLGSHTAQGFANGINSGSGAVSNAMTGLTQVPNIPRQSTFSPAGFRSAPNIQITVSGSDQLAQAVQSMIKVEVDGSVVKLGNAAALVSSRPVG